MCVRRDEFSEKQITNTPTPEEEPISNTPDPTSNPSETLIERVTDFMDTYNEN
jgi:hypothetical protein